jgi:APA family basic amino acid/polyamine antiporter
VRHSDTLQKTNRESCMKAVLRGVFARLPVASAFEDAHGQGLKRVLGPWSLTSIGLGATIGSGIFALAGTVAATHTGPALTLSLLIAAVGCGITALCYAELSAMIPVSGSAYTYTYASLGELIGWFVGWNLMLEYLMSAAAVAVSWSGYVVNLLEQGFAMHLPAALVNAPFGRLANGEIGATGAIVNVPAVAIVIVLGWVCYIGVRESSTVNNAMVLLKCGIIVTFVLAGLRFIETANWHPYMPPNTGKFGEFGWSGVLQGAAIILFSYIGFDTASTTTQEARNPQRDVPLGILGALGVSLLLYAAMATVMTGMVPYKQLDVPAPAALALDLHPTLGWLAIPVKIGAVIGMTSVILMSMLGQPRILMVMSKDGLLPAAMRRIHPKHKTPDIATIVTVVCAAAISGLFPLDVLGELISIGTLLAFAGVCAAVLILRRKHPELPRTFRVPWAPVMIPIGIVVCLGGMWVLPLDTWKRLAWWSALGISIYAVYGYRHSRLRSAKYVEG